MRHYSSPSKLFLVRRILMASLSIFAVASVQAASHRVNDSLVLNQTQNIHISTTISEVAPAENHRPKIALVLGSGGARGYAHIGVIKVLEENGITPDFIVGTSAGSIVGALYASGKTSKQLEDIALALKVSDVRDFTLSKQGFFDGQKIEDYINKQVNVQSLENLKIPLYVVATELKTGKEIVFHEGNTGKAVRASTSIPSMFVPTKIGNEEYVDGGLVSPVPVDVAKRLGADIIIAVNILAKPEYTETSNMWGLFNQNINVMQNRLAYYEAEQADILIQPDVREKQHVFSTKSRKETIEAGEKSTLDHIDRIKNLIEYRKFHIADENVEQFTGKQQQQFQYISSN
ncbi:patatin-like phospholipase family protein [Acinetobacter populi]|nr:patatin-like phospholipase family protein [Acinetobacter populi]